MRNEGTAILGAGGFAREAYWQIRTTAPDTPLVFVDDITDRKSIVMGTEKVPIVNNWNFSGLTIDDKELTITSFVAGVGSPEIKRLLVSKALEAGLHPSATFVHPRATIVAPDCKVGMGGIIMPGVVITTNVTIGDYVILYMNTTIGHDATIGDYVTCNPGAGISGNVVIGEGTMIGVGAVVRERVRIAPGCLAGAQACIVKDVMEPNTVIVGVPAKNLD
ncbi:MAG: acetyltransferase [Candidatus Hydrogenedentes bacterium]|nr:acetyltransferase [Candidatus Hydrogenedentota bacterium]